MTVLGKSLRERISGLKNGGNMRYGMTIHLNVLGRLMKDGVSSNLNSTRVVGMKRSRLEPRKTKFG